MCVCVCVNLINAVAQAAYLLLRDSSLETQIIFLSIIWVPAKLDD